MTKPTIGLIGAGRIGNPLALNLLGAGYPVTVYDIRAEAVANLVETGVQFAASPRIVGQNAEIIFLSLTTVDVVETVLFGEEGICAEPLAGAVIIDTSTLMPTRAQYFAQRVSECGGVYLDAPVTGGEGGAKAGTLSFMLGGPEETVKAVMLVLEVVGGTITHMGPSGAGHAAKLVNQLIMCGYFAVITEGFSLAERLGLDMGQLMAAIENGGAQSSMLSNLGRAYCQHQEAPPDATPEYDHYGEVFLKDIYYALQEGHEHRMYMPVSSTAHELFKQMLSRDGGGMSFPLRLMQVWKD